MDKLYRMIEICPTVPQEVIDYAECKAIGLRQFIGYIQAVDEDIMLRVFAFRKKKSSPLELTEVMRRITGAKGCAFKNIYSSGMSGYHAVYEPRDKVIRSHGYPVVIFSKREFDKWNFTDTVLGMGYIVINTEMLKETIFKYSGYSPEITDDVIGYLDKYIADPNVEFFGKLGLKPSKTLIKKAERDKHFRSWLFAHRGTFEHYGPKVILCAYAENLDLKTAARLCDDRMKALKKMPELKDTDLDRSKVIAYALQKNVGCANYNDYLKALKKLGYDLSDTKNSFPHDFKRMHDMRIAEYESVIAKEDAEKRKEFYTAFQIKAQEAKRYEYSDETYAVIIPGSVYDLVREGERLHHCVGRMGYDRKMANGEIVIAFVRPITDILTPFVTVEYSLRKKKLIQAYGDHDIPPTEEVKAFIGEWESIVTKSLKEQKWTKTLESQ